MVSLRSLVLLLVVTAMGCSLVNAPDTHTRGRDAGRATADAPASAATTLRVAHLARDNGAVDVYANGSPVAAGLSFANVSVPGPTPGGSVAFRVTRAGTSETLIEQTLAVAASGSYTLTLYGDEVSPPFPERSLALALFLEDTSGLNTTRDIRLAAVHVASPIIEGALVAILPDGNETLAEGFGFTDVASLTLAAMGYTVGFDAGADGIIDVEFIVPALAPGTYATVFVAARPDDSVFLLVNTSSGMTLEIDVPTEPSLRIAHLARDAGPVDVFAGDREIATGIEFANVDLVGEVAAGPIPFRVTRTGTNETLLSETIALSPGGMYTLTFYGDQAPPSEFPERTLALLLLNDDASGLDTRREVRLAAVHVASPVIAGQLVSIQPKANETLVEDFAFTGVASLTLPSRPYTVGFDAEADGTIDLEFSLPSLVPGTYANVFVAARPDNSVFLLVNTSRGATLQVNPR